MPRRGVFSISRFRCMPVKEHNNMSLQRDLLGPLPSIMSELRAATTCQNQLQPQTHNCVRGGVLDFRCALPPKRESTTNWGFVVDSRLGRLHCMQTPCAQLVRANKACLLRKAS